MRLRRLLSASALLSSRACAGPSAAFQVPAGRGEKLAAAAARRRRVSPLLKGWAALPLSKSKRGGGGRLLKLPGLRKKSLSRSAGGEEEEPGDEQFDRRILALVTTCCAACLLRPDVASAAAGASLVDPFPLNCEEVPGLGMLPCGLPRWNPAFADRTVRGTLGLLAQTLAAVGALAAALVMFVSANLLALAAVRSACDWCGGIASAWRWSALFVKCHASSGAGSSSEVRGRRDAAVKIGTAAKVDWADYLHKLPILSKIENGIRGDVAPERNAEDGAKLQEAARTFQEKKRRLHERESEPEPVAAGGSDLPDGESSTWRDYELHLSESRARQAGRSEGSDRARNVQIMKNLLTWEDYKHLIGELQDSKKQVEDLNEEVAQLRGMLQIEHAIHQAAPARVPNVPEGKETEKQGGSDAMAKRAVALLEDSCRRRAEELDGEVSELQGILRAEQSLHRAALDRMSDSVGSGNREDELKELGEKSRMYEEAVRGSLSLSLASEEDGEGVDWHEEQDMGSGIK